MEKILCIEDSPEAIFIIENTLKDFDLKICSSLAEAQDLISKNLYKVIIIDIELPDGRGPELMPLIQKNMAQTSVIFLTSHTEFHEKLIAFSLGAVDYIQKPFDPRELKLRVEAQIQRMKLQNNTNQIIEIGELACNVDEQKVYLKDDSKKTLDLTSIEYKIFKLLSKNSKKTLPREEILEKVWGKTISITARTVDVHISNLRRKLTNTGVSIHYKHNEGFHMLSTLNDPRL